MSVGILGAGAFGTSLAITLARKTNVILWARDAEHAADMQTNRVNNLRLPKCGFPDDLSVTSNLKEALALDVILLAIPMQKLAGFLEQNASFLQEKILVGCCKGVDRASGLGPVNLIQSHVPSAKAAILTGPSFALDIARGLPTALTLACADQELCKSLQTQISTPSLRIYRTTDTTGAQIGGALKNVMAIACGAAIGAGLGESARAALLTRGFAEMTRFAMYMGAQPRTLSGLSGFGDLTLTCTSLLSRNYQFGLSLGAGETFDNQVTVEGAETALAVSELSKEYGLEMPITNCMASVLKKQTTVFTAINELLSRPLKEE